MNKNIEKVGEHYIRRSKFWGDKIVHPWKNEEGKVMWFNIVTGGSWGNLLFITLVFLAVMVSVFAYKSDISEYKKVTTMCLENPCQWCSVIQQNQLQSNKLWEKDNLTRILSEINLSKS